MSLLRAVLESPLEEDRAVALHPIGAVDLAEEKGAQQGPASHNASKKRCQSCQGPKGASGVVMAIRTHDECEGIANIASEAFEVAALPL